ncbi:hypothetical protein PTI98_009570 [Pleurotus ostreatus]|nr:hypothetical protein PTI98_009570 [Pleurotus ostreatus]
MSSCLLSYLKTSRAGLVSQRLAHLRDIASGLSHYASSIYLLSKESICIDKAGNIKLCNSELAPLLYRYATQSDLREVYVKNFRWADPCLWYYLFINQLHNWRHVETFGTDIYAFGCVTYQMVSNEVPFALVASNERELWYATVQSAPEHF